VVASSSSSFGHVRPAVEVPIFFTGFPCISARLPTFDFVSAVTFGISFQEKNPPGLDCHLLLLWPLRIDPVTIERLVSFQTRLFSSWFPTFIMDLIFLLPSPNWTGLLSAVAEVCPWIEYLPEFTDTPPHFF